MQLQKAKKHTIFKEIKYFSPIILTFFKYFMKSQTLALNMDLTNILRALPNLNKSSKLIISYNTGSKRSYKLIERQPGNYTGKNTRQSFQLLTYE